MFGLMAMLLAGVLALTGCSGDESEAVSEISGNIVISEVMSTNSYYLPLADGSCHDWIEFHNISQSAVNLKGCMLSDKARTANKWKVMTDLVIQPDGYGLIILSGLDKVDEQGYIHANFKLSSKGENLIFSDPSGSVIQQLEVPECTMRNISYGLPDGAEEYLWYAEPTPGSANAGNTSAVPDQLVFPKSGLLINEYMTKNTYVIYDSQSRYCDWIEIYNSSDQDVSLRGYSLSDSESGGGQWFFPSDAVIGAGQYAVVFCSSEGSDDKNELHADFSLKTGDVITLYSVSGKLVDSVRAEELNANVSCGRDPESGQFRLFASPTPGRANTTYSYELTSAVMPSPTAPVYVNEVMCVSAKGETYNKDFIEIYNSSDGEISLGGYGLSKNESGAVFKFPAVTIPAGGYRVVYCTGKNSSKADKTLTAAFKLGQDGESIFFFDPEGHIIDIFHSEGLRPASRFFVRRRVRFKGLYFVHDGAGGLYCLLYHRRKPPFCFLQKIHKASDHQWKQGDQRSLLPRGVPSEPVCHRDLSDRKGAQPSGCLRHLRSRRAFLGKNRHSLQSAERTGAGSAQLHER